MVKRLKGLYQDTAPVDQPEGTYRDARNANLNLDVGAISTEEGFKRLTNSGLPSNYIPLQYVLVDDKIVIFSANSTGNGSEIGYLKDEEYTQIINDSDLNFSISATISATVKTNNKKENVIYWTDGINPPRKLNIDDVPAYSDVNELNLFFNFESALEAELGEVRPYGGSLFSGSYQFAISYLDKDGNKTNYISVTNPIRVHGSNYSVGDMQGDEPNSPTSCSIELNLTNIDTNYDRIEVAVLHYTEGTLASAKILPSYRISGSTLNIVHSGQETFTETSLEEVVINSASYATAKYMTQQDDTLYLGNLTRDTDIGYQKYANNIKVTGITKDLLDENQGDKFAQNGFDLFIPEIEYYNRTFRRDEVYAFYISFILKDGTESYAYHIPGREAEGNELVALNGSALDPNEVRFYNLDSNAKRFHYTALKGSNNLAYWENEQETYPTGEDWEIWDVDGSGTGAQDGSRTLEGEKVRHHRFPETLSASVTDGDGSYANILGVRFENIKIPSDIKDKVIGFKFYHAKKDDSNRLVFGDSLFIPQITTEIDSTFYYTNLVPEPNQSGTFDPNTGAVIPFNLMRTRSGIGGINYVKNYAEAGDDDFRVTGITGSDVSITGEKKFYPRSVLSLNDDYRLRVISAKTYIPANTEIVNIKGLGFDYDKRSFHEESQILLNFEDTESDVAYDCGDAGDSQTSFSYLCTLHAHKTELFNSFDQQELVWTGILETDLDKYDPSSGTYDGGTQSEGSVVITEDAPPSISSVVLFVSADSLDTGFTLVVEETGGHSNTVALTTGDDIDTIGAAIESLVNGDASYPFSASYDAGTNVLTFTWTGGSMTGTESITFKENGQADLSGVDLSVSENPATFSYGDDEGTIEIGIGRTPGVDLVYTVQYGDTALDIANGLKAYWDTNPVAKDDEYTVTVDNSGADPLLEIIAINPGVDGDTTLYNSGDSTVVVTLNDPTGGSDPSNFTEDNYGGDAFLGTYGFRISNYKPSTSEPRKFMGRYLSEGIDNVSLRNTGSEFGQLNPNLTTNWADIADYELDDDDDSGDLTHDNYYGYDESYSKLGDTKSAIPRPKVLDEISNFPTRVIKSQTQDETVLDRFRVFLENDFLDFPRNRGEITNLAILDNILLVHTKHSLYRTKGREQLATDDFRAFIGNGNIFEIKPDELKTTKTGFAGTGTSNNCLEFKWGYFFVDDISKKIYLMGDGLKELSENGMRRFFNENLEWFIDEVEDHNNIAYTGISLEYDDEYNRILLTKTDYKPTDTLTEAIFNEEIEFNSTTNKFNIVTPGNEREIEYSETDYFEDKSFTISYLPEINAWVSFHDYMPLFYMKDRKKLYSYDLSDEKFYKHNHKDYAVFSNYCYYYQTQYSFHIQVISNPNPEITKQLINFEYILHTLDQDTERADWDKNFERFRVRNDIQDSGIQDFIYFTSAGGNSRNIEGTWRINKFRDFIDPATGTLDTNLEWHKQKRFIGKYAQIDLYYDTPDKVKLSLISLRANFKQSIR